MTLYWDLTNGQLVRSQTDATPIVELTMIARDTLTLTLSLLQEDGNGGYQAYTPAAGYVPLLTGKPAAALAGAARFSAALADAGATWDGTLVLTDDTLLTEVDAAGTAGVSYVGELTLYNESTQVDAMSLQFTVLVKPDVHRSGDAAPAGVVPYGPWEWYTAADGRKGLRLRNADGTIVGEFIEP